MTRKPTASGHTTFDTEVTWDHGSQVGLNNEISIIIVYIPLDKAVASWCRVQWLDQLRPSTSSVLWIIIWCIFSLENGMYCVVFYYEME